LATVEVLLAYFVVRTVVTAVLLWVGIKVVAFSNPKNTLLRALGVAALGYAISLLPPYPLLALSLGCMGLLKNSPYVSPSGYGWVCCGLCTQGCALPLDELGAKLTLGYSMESLRDKAAKNKGGLFQQARMVVASILLKAYEQDVGQTVAVMCFVLLANIAAFKALGDLAGRM